MFFLFLIVWFAYWSGESGASLPWSHKWQSKVSWFSEVSEAIIAFSIAGIGIWGWNEIFDYGPLWCIILFLIYSAVAYAGKQSGTWAYLRWESHNDPDTERGGTLKGFNDFIAGLFGYKLGDEGYAWTWAATKGFVITIPIGAVLGMVFFPVGHEIGSHAKGRLPGDPNMWKELASGGGLGIACSLFIAIIIAITA